MEHHPAADSAAGWCLTVAGKLEFIGLSDLRNLKPPSDEGGGFCEAKDGGRDCKTRTSGVSLPQSALRAASSLVRGSLVYCCANSPTNSKLPQQFKEKPDGRKSSARKKNSMDYLTISPLAFFSSISFMASLRERLTRPFSSISVTLTHIISPMLHTSSTFSTRLLSSLEI